MIPAYPAFKKLELEDKQGIEMFTKNFPPYSDFNFTSLWCWDTKGQVRLSQLYGNLVVRFSDYESNNLFYSILGTENITDAINELLNLVEAQNNPFGIKLIPEEVCKLIKPDSDRYRIIEDRDHFDYLYNLTSLANLEGPDFHKKRSEIRRFIRGKQLFIHEIDLSNSASMIDILKVNYNWMAQKKIKEAHHNVMNELHAIDKFLKIKNKKNYVIVGIELDDSLIAFSINEITSDQYAIGHFFKSSRMFGLFDLLMKETASLLSKRGIMFLNFEQDLGVPGLRESKLSFRPSSLLKKFAVLPR